MSEKEKGCRIVFDLRPGSDHAACVLDWLERGGWCWGLGVPPDTSSEILAAIHARGWNVVLELHGNDTTRSIQWKNWRKPVPDVDETVRRFREILGENVVWQVILEDDSSGVGFSRRLLTERPKSHANAMALFDKYLDEVTSVANRHPDIPKWGVCGFASSTHPLASRKLDQIIVERANDDVDDLQTAIAFARGAASQYGCAWGIDLSLWWGAIFGCIQNLPSDFHKRHLYLSFFSGTQAFRIEGGDLFWDFAANAPTRIAGVMDEFGRFSRRVSPGVADVPVAVMLSRDHGWITPPYWRTTNEAWNYARVPYRQGQRGIDGLFAAAYPGSVYAMDPFPAGDYVSDEVPASPFALSCVTPEYAPLPENVYFSEPPIPFGRFRDRNEAREAVHAGTANASAYRPMADSRWGDIFDVITSEASDRVLAKYPVLIMAGPVRVDAGLAHRLIAYAEAGGTVVMAAGVAGPDTGDLCGAQLGAELNVGRAWCWGAEPAMHEAFRYLSATPAKDTQVMAATPQGAPLVITRVVGKGRIVTCLVPWYEAGHTPLAKLALRLFDEIIRPVQPVRVEGLPVEWLSTSGDGEKTVLVANHDANPWCGAVRLPLDNDFGKCTELVTGSETGYRRDEDGWVACALEVPAYDVRVLRWTR